MPQADAFHHRKDWRPQVSVRPMRRRRSNADARYTGLDHKRTAAAETTVGPRELTHEHTERPPEGRMLFRFVRDPGEPSPGPAPGVNKPPSLTGTFLFPVAGQRECAPCQSATGVMWLTAFVGLGNGIRRSSIRAASRRIAPGWSEGFHKGTHAPRLRSRPS